MFLDLLRTRRSIRSFEEREVEPEKIDALVEAVLRAPSSRGLNPWEFTVVTDRKLIEKLSRAKAHGSAFMKGAPLAIVVCADPERCDVWIEDTSIASILLHLAATDLGLGSCWVQIRLREHGGGGSAEQYVADLIDLKPGRVVESMIAIGYPKEIKQGHPRASLLFDRVNYIPER
jgi:nitroreductase